MSKIVNGGVSEVLCEESDRESYTVSNLNEEMRDVDSQSELSANEDFQAQKKISQINTVHLIEKALGESRCESELDLSIEPGTFSATQHFLNKIREFKEDHKSQAPLPLKVTEKDPFREETEEKIVTPLETNTQKEIGLDEITK